MNGLFIRNAKSQELAYIARLVGEIFPAPPLLYHEIHHLPENANGRHLVGFKDGSMVSYAQIQRRTLMYGRAALEVACIGPIFTLPQFRGRGYATSMMFQLVAHMAESGAHLALLNGDADHRYDQFGFSAVWPYYTASFPVEALARLRPRAGLRALRPEDLSEVADLYQVHWGGRVTFSRSPEYWLWLARRDRLHLQVLDDEEGRVDGYLAMTSWNDPYIELVANSEDSALTMLAYLGRALQAQGRAECRLFLMPDDALLAFARPYVPVTVGAQYRSIGGWMARLLDTSGLMQVLLPELTVQAQAAYPDFPAEQLVFRLQPDTVEIGLKGYNASFSRLDHRDFIQILFGSLRPQALAMRAGLAPDARHLLEMLFPPRMAALAPLDWF